MLLLKHNCYCILGKELRFCFFQSAFPGGDNSDCAVREIKASLVCKSIFNNTDTFILSECSLSLELAMIFAASMSTYYLRLVFLAEV